MIRRDDLNGAVEAYAESAVVPWPVPDLFSRTVVAPLVEARFGDRLELLSVSGWKCNGMRCVEYVFARNDARKPGVPSGVQHILGVDEKELAQYEGEALKDRLALEFENMFMQIEELLDA